MAAGFCWVGCEQLLQACECAAARVRVVVRQLAHKFLQAVKTKQKKNSTRAAVTYRQHLQWLKAMKAELAHKFLQAVE
jgi:hypothetical protein